MVGNGRYRENAFHGNTWKFLGVGKGSGISGEE